MKVRHNTNLIRRDNHLKSEKRDEIKCCANAQVCWREERLLLVLNLVLSIVIIYALMVFDLIPRVRKLGVVMYKIFVKEFSAIATESGTKKLSLIKKQKNRAKYHPSADYYKKFREKIVYILKHRKQLIELNALVDEISKEKKDHYSTLSKSFISWAKGKNIEWHEPVRESLFSSNTEVVCNPELNLTIEGEKWVIKMYFSVNERMTQDRANYICFTMQAAFDLHHNNYGVLDVKSKKLYKFKGNTQNFSISIDSEIASIEKAWEQL